MSDPSVPPPPPPGPGPGAYSPGPTGQVESKKILAGVLGILLGGLGVHKFVLGYTKEGLLQILITVVTCGIGSIIGLIEGIIYLTKSDQEFIQTYQIGRKGWF
jgi:TM2 domain-containing membrane protein YozV